MRHQSGFGVITVIVVLVMLAVLAGGLVTLGTTQSNVLSQDVLSARAEQAARAGTQWGLFQAFSGAAVWGGANCDNATFAAPVTATINPVAGFQVTVDCGSARYNEGQQQAAPNLPVVVRVYRVRAIACPAGATPCPRNDGTVSASNYVERRREAIGI